MRKKIDYYFIRLFLGMGSVLPERLIYLLSTGLLKLYYALKPKRIALMHSNIQKAFPRLSGEEVIEFGKEVYQEVAKTMAELVLIYADRLDIDKVVVNQHEAVQKLKAIDQKAANGVIYIMAHYGNWELLGQFMAKNGYPLVGVVKEGRNRDIEQEILIPFRAKYGNESVGHASSMIAITKALKAQKRVSLAIDQVVQPPNGVLVDFFGHQTAATKAIAMLKLKYHPLVVPIFITRVGEQQFTVDIHDPVEPLFEGGLPEEEKIVVMTQQYYDIIEIQIRKAPTQWLWLYNRWKAIHAV
jgi:KDO2-lipid IV(A) lauroyltransferase